MDEARLNLQKEIHIHLNAKDKLLHLTAQAETPQAAQTLAQAILNQTFTNSQPRDSEKMRLQKQLEQAQTREKMAQQSADVMGKKLESITTGGSSEVAQGYAQMIRVVQESQAAQNDIERQLNGLDSSELVQEPTLPTKHKEIKRGLISFLAMQFVLFIIFLKITTSIAIKNSAENIDNIKKIENIKNTFKKSIYFWKI
jgi:capsule polysaccharide export protein KpsE/RkpR